ncbi:MAG: thiamine pyrophosphate-binding protein [Bacteroidales bacterium]|jgi:acetolactate synthase-1/2/3 large subunit|nr:thiamine pyrophosphate-binding protein [Bacteroidales bacterium]
MKQRVADYIADFLVSRGITDLFTITGGGAMYLNDAFGHHPQLHCTYNHHEQACAIAAEAYARYSGNIAAVCVTSGPGGTNAITGVLGGWLDSVPMFILSGQIKFSTSIKSTKIPLRQLGDQEFNITDCIKTITKFSKMIINPNDIAYFLEKALYIARHGRPGPVWLDIPLNVQGAVIETESLSHYDPAENSEEIPPKVHNKILSEILQKIKRAKRPVIFVGSAVRSSGAHDDFLRLIDKLQIPVVTAWNAHDVIWDDHPLYCGRPGTIGTRGGNFVVQKSDLLLILGCRLNIRQISYNWNNFAPDAYKIMVDIDPGELFKPTLSINLPIYADVKDFISSLNAYCGKTINNHKAWLEWGRNINSRHPICLADYYKKITPINPYVFMKELFLCLEEGDVVVASNGSACVCSFQAAVLKKNQRLFTNSGCASMGYGLPASLGVAIEREGKRVICLEGDGSIQMNLQELQTIVHNKLNIKIFWLNNNGYHSIRQTQTNLFTPPLCGVSSENGVSFPDAQKIACAYNIPFFKIESISQALTGKIQQALLGDGPSIIEVVLDQEQCFEPKLSSKRLSDGTMVSSLLEDMYPFLPEAELKKIMQEAETI